MEEAIENILSAAPIRCELVEKKGRAVGISVMDKPIIAWAVPGGRAVIVAASPMADGSGWMFAGWLDGKEHIAGVIVGGRYRAARYVRFIRNGIVSQAFRKRGTSKLKGGE